MEARALPEEIQTPRLTLRKQRQAYAPLMFAVADAERERLGRFLPWVENTRGVEDEMDFVRLSLENWEEKKGFNYAIFTRADDQYCGNIGVFNIQWEHDAAEVGYWVRAACEGRGMLSEALQGLEQAMFDAGFNRIELRCNVENQRSAAVAKRNGYALEGRLRQAHFEFGGYRDNFVFSKLRADSR